MSQNESPASPCTNLGDSIRIIAPTAILVRLYPVRQAVTYFFEGDFHLLLLGQEAGEKAARLIRRNFGGNADWRRTHDFYLPTGRLYLTPEPNQKGYVPEDDFSFGLMPSRLISTSDRNGQ